jgi:hypothetical protein
VYLHVVTVHIPTITAALAYDPAPENGRGKERTRAIPAQWTDPTDAMQGSGDVSTIANDVNDQGIGNKFFDERKIKQVQRSAFGPALGPLFAGYSLHYYAQKITGIAAIFHHSLVDILGREAGALKQHAVVIGVEQMPAVLPMREIAESKAEQIEGIALRVINSEPPRRE